MSEHHVRPATPGFRGRDEELAWLLRLWDEASARVARGRSSTGPRMAILVAETGIGKSRVVQELYHRLTADPRWDPPAASYWPDAFQTPGAQVRVNPELEGHEPQGPPHFLWLGGRWQPPDHRNPEERTYLVPALRETLATHVRVAQRHQDAWRRARAELAKALRNKPLAGEVVEKVVDLSGIPYGGLLLKLAKGGLALTRERLGPPGSAPDHAEEAHLTAADELLAELREVFGAPGSGGLVLPTVLWLDDAHWADESTLRFLRRLWDEAGNRQWPLLVVLTHWEREWRELTRLRRLDQDAPLWWFQSQAGVEVRVLPPAAEEDLRAYLRDALPGLTTEQQARMLEKAAGNFLTLVENVGNLKEESGFFIGGDISGALSEAGEEEVRTWESERERRVEQRFKKLSGEVKRTLGWGSRMGQRFVAEVIDEYARSLERASSTGLRTGAQIDARAALDVCVDPYAILGVPSPRIREFRDRAFRDVAREHFDRLCRDDHAGLTRTLKAVLAGWVNRSFDAMGELLPSVADQRDTPPSSAYNPGTTGIGLQEALPNAATALPPAELRNLLSLAYVELPIPTNPDWSEPEHLAALRAPVLAIHAYSDASLWSLLAAPAARLRGVDWSTVPPAAASARVLARVGDALFYCDLNADAEPLLRHALRVGDGRSEPDHLGTAAALDGLALLEHARGDLDIAKQLLERAIGIRESVLGAGHPDVATSLTRLGWICNANGEPDAALPLLVRAVKILETELGSEHRDLTKVLPVLSHVYRARNELDVAEPLAAKAVQIAEAALGPEHPRAATALYELASIHRARGDHAAAEPLFRRALAIWEAAFGADHINVAAALQGLGWVHRDRNDLGAAERLFRRALAISEAALGPEHAGVAFALQGLGWVHHDRGDYRGAEQLFRRALAICEAALGAEHPRVADALYELASIYRAGGEHAAAEPLYRRALAIFDAGRGPQSATVADALYGLASIYHSRGEFDEAAPLYRQSVEIRERALGPKHPRVSNALYSLAALHMSQGRYDQAETLFRRTTEIRDLALGPEHIEVANALYGLGSALRYQGKLDAALPPYERAVAIRKAVLGPTHPDVASALFVVALVHCDKGEYHAAEPLFRRVVDIREASLGVEHPEVGRGLYALACVHLAQRQDRFAEPLLRRALANFENTLGPGHPQFASVLYALALVHRARGEDDMGESLMERAMRIFEAAQRSDRQSIVFPLSGLISVHRARGETDAADRLLRSANRNSGDTQALA